MGIGDCSGRFEHCGLGIGILTMLARPWCLHTGGRRITMYISRGASTRGVPQSNWEMMEEHRSTNHKLQAEYLKSTVRKNGVYSYPCGDGMEMVYQVVEVVSLGRRFVATTTRRSFERARLSVPVLVQAYGSGDASTNSITADDETLHKIPADRDAVGLIPFREPMRLDMMRWAPFNVLRHQLKIWEARETSTSFLEIHSPRIAQPPVLAICDPRVPELLVASPLQTPYYLIHCMEFSARMKGGWGGR